MPAWTKPYSKSGVFPMPAFTKSTLFQRLETFQTNFPNFPNRYLGTVDISRYVYRN